MALYIKPSVSKQLISEIEASLEKFLVQVEYDNTPDNDTEIMYLAERLKMYLEHFKKDISHEVKENQ